MESMNCLFCYCPLYFLPECPGHREYIESQGRRILSCKDCDYPHRAENYGEMMRILKATIAATGDAASENPKKDEPSEERETGGKDECVEFPEDTGKATLGRASK